MDFNTIFSTNTMLQSISVGLIVYFIRLWLEAKWNNLESNKIFTGAILPSLALLISFLITFLLPFNTNYSSAEKLAYSLICGFSSSFLFSALKGFLSHDK